MSVGLRRLGRGPGRVYAKSSDTLFLMIGHPRAGNIFLTRILDQSPLAYCVGEIFNDDPEHDHVKAAAALLGAAPPLDVKQVQRLVKLVRKARGVDHVGLTLFDKPIHTLGEAGVRALIDERCPVVLLHRRDLLEAFCSWERAYRSNIWHRDAKGQTIRWECVGDAIADQDSFHVDPEAAGAWIARTTAFLGGLRNYLGKTECRFLEVEYEELCSADASISGAVVARVFEEIGLPPFPYEVKTSRTSSDEAYAKIVNWSELRERFPARSR